MEQQNDKPLASTTASQQTMRFSKSRRCHLSRTLDTLGLLEFADLMLPPESLERQECKFAFLYRVGHPSLNGRFLSLSSQASVAV
jgi:hypothetical protein